MQFAFISHHFTSFKIVQQVLILRSQLFITYITATFIAITFNTFENLSH